MGFQPEPFAQRLCSLPLHVYVSNHTHQLTNFSSWLATTVQTRKKYSALEMGVLQAERPIFSAVHAM